MPLLRLTVPAVKRSSAFAALAAAVVVGTAPDARADGADPLFALVDAAAERLQIAEPVAAYKWSTHAEIEDPVRVERELAALREEAGQANVDPDYIVRVFSDQIGATEAIEYARFADWKLDPASVPSAAGADLSASRAAIDALNTKILSQISLNRSLLNSPSCGGQLERARADAIRLRHFDNIYRRALMAATRSYCPAPPAA